LAVKILVGVVAFGVAFFFAFKWARNMQSNVNEKSTKAAKESDGGQVGHIADLYSVLDATDPDRYSRDYPSESTPRIPRRSKDGADGADADDESAEKALPIIPPVWTMDVMTAKVPEGRANGSISGTNFVVDIARLDVVGNATVLSLRQGTNLSPDRELLVYLHPKPGEKVAGGSWAVAKEMKGLAVPQVAKRWKPNPKYAATTKSFSSGYTMRLELGQISDGEVRGKIYVALPDTEKSVVGGIFKATTSLEDTTNLFRTRIRMDDSDF